MLQSLVNLDFQENSHQSTDVCLGVMSQHNIRSIPYLIYLYIYTPFFRSAIIRLQILSTVKKRTLRKMTQTTTGRLWNCDHPYVSLSTFSTRTVRCLMLQWFEKVPKNTPRTKRIVQIHVDEIIEDQIKIHPPSKFNSTTLPVCVVGFNWSLLFPVWHVVFVAP